MAIPNFTLLMYQFFKYWPQSKNFGFTTIQIDRKYYEDGMSNNLHFFDPWGYIIILKYETTLEKHLTKLQNLTLYNTNIKFLQIIASTAWHTSLLSLWTT